MPPAGRITHLTSIGKGIVVPWFRPVLGPNFSNLGPDHGSGSATWSNFGLDPPNGSKWSGSRSGPVRTIKPANLMIDLNNPNARRIPACLTTALGRRLHYISLKVMCWARLGLGFTRLGITKMWARPELRARPSLGLVGLEPGLQCL